jgi:hypothetical protein
VAGQRCSTYREVLVGAAALFVFDDEVARQVFDRDGVWLPLRQTIESVIECRIRDCVVEVGNTDDQ